MLLGDAVSLLERRAARYSRHRKWEGEWRIGGTDLRIASKLLLRHHADMSFFFRLSPTRLLTRHDSPYPLVPPRQILSGQKVTVVRCEEINVSGSFFRNKLKYHAYLHSKSCSSDALSVTSVTSLQAQIADESQRSTWSTPGSPVPSTSEHHRGSCTRPSEEWCVFLRANTA